MPRLSPAQIANQVTFILKGHLKNARIAYIRAAALLARVRDQKLWQALKYPTIEDYAEKQLGLRRSALYQYLQIHDWLREHHRGWLARRPKGFIPEISDIIALMWIEDRLRDSHLGDEARKQLEAARRNALVGKLTDSDFRELRKYAQRTVKPLRTLLRRLRSVRRYATSIKGVPESAISSIDAAIRDVERAAQSSAKVIQLSRRRN